MRYAYLILICFLNVYILQGQTVVTNNKPALTLEGLEGNWSTVTDGMLSGNGNYASYNIYGKNGPRCYLESTCNNWKVEYGEVSSPMFTPDSKFFIYKKSADSLCIVNLEKKKTVWFSKVMSYKIQPGDTPEWLAYFSTISGKELVLYHLKTGKEQKYPSVSNYLFSPNGDKILLEMKNSDGATILQWVNIRNDQKQLVWSDKLRKPISYVFDNRGNQFAFITEEKEDQTSTYSIWIYRDKTSKAELLADNKMKGIDKSGTITRFLLQFSKDDQSVLFNLQPLPLPKSNPEAVKVDVWSYHDKELQSLQLSSLKYPIVYTFAVRVNNKWISRLEQENEKIVGSTNGYVLVKYALGNNGLFESNWNTAAQIAFYLVSTNDGARKLLKDRIVNMAGGLGVSATGKWILYYDFDRKDFFSYEVSTGITRNITQGSGVVWSTENDDHPEERLSWFPGAHTWLANDEAVLIYDTYDIWLVDPTGNKKPFNVTNGYGRAHQVKLRLVDEGETINKLSLQKAPDLLLKAVNLETKDWGYFRKKLGGTGDPEKLVMGPYIYGHWEGYDTYNDPPVKAKNSNTYLLLKMSATQAPNYIVTHDFKMFKPLTNEQPQKAFNWFTTELVHWRTPDGKTASGILYKPENFDPTMKYPVIFDYYERRSDELNLFIPPHASENRINIPMFVSNGYLVFAPDIHYRIGDPGGSAYDAVVSAAEHIAKLPFVDASRMGLQGHSWGGYQTNYIITHTNLFAAACAASGFCDLISWYGADARAGYPKYHAERDQGRMGGTPWDIQEQYIKNSPIFNADKVSTPLLMMNNKGDNVVYMSQGIEFFSALRRLGKKVWMLQYDEGYHSLSFGKNAVDFHIRMVQFFDHYLKGKPAPVWMTKGIPARFKGIENGLGIEESLSVPASLLSRKGE